MSNNLLSKIEIKNFKCFRDSINFSLLQGTYFIGSNNAGKTAVLKAINFFFDDLLYNDESFLNRTAYLAKKGGYNKAEITIHFNLSSLTSNVLKSRLMDYFNGKIAIIKKIAIYSPDSGKMSFSYEIENKPSGDFDELNKDVKKMIESVKVTYIHPQEGRELLLNAQGKLKQRLLANWGRNPKLSHSINELQEKWDILRKQARSYLSASLTDSAQKMWPESQAYIDLPRDIRDIVAISDIKLRSGSLLPEIELASQGTGAQSTILYLANYLLDSDRSLHRGEYHPIWLLEEPESFLHADLMFKFATELNSENWLKNIQMIISTHSPIILATSRIGGKNIFWNLVEDGLLKKGNRAEDWKEDEIIEVGKIMGDTNFYAYFLAAQKTPLILIEDAKELTTKKYIEGGIPVTKGLNGIGEVARYLDVYKAGPIEIDREIFFVVDADKGMDELTRFYDSAGLIDEKNKFKKFIIKDAKNIFIILLPSDLSAEDLFLEFDNHLEECISKLWDTKTWAQTSSIPRELYRTYGKIRSRAVSSKEEAKELIKKTDDVKDIFWQKVEKYNYRIDNKNILSIKHLLKIGPG